MIEFRSEQAIAVLSVFKVDDGNNQNDAKVWASWLVPHWNADVNPYTNVNKSSPVHLHHFAVPQWWPEAGLVSSLS